MTDRILGEFVQIKEYNESKTFESRPSMSLASSRIVTPASTEKDTFNPRTDNTKVRWVWFDGKLLKCSLFEDESAEQFGQILSLILLESGPVSSITGSVDFVKTEDPSADYVLVSGRSRYGVLKSLSESKSNEMAKKANITLKDLDNRVISDAFLRLNNPDYSSEGESRYYPALFIGKKDETWKGVVKMEAFNRNISIRRSDGRLITSRYVLLKEVMVDEEAKPLEKDRSISSENEPVSPISIEHQHLLLELASPIGGRLYVSPKLANFNELPLPCLIGLPLKLTTPLNKSELDVFSSEIDDHLVIEGSGMTWGVEKKEQNHSISSHQDESDVWSKLESVAHHHESPHKQRKTPECLEKEVLQHGPTVSFKEVGVFDYSPKSPSKSILKASSRDRLSSEEKQSRERSLSSPPREIGSIKWKEDIENKEEEKHRTRTSSETKIISEKRTYFENGNIVTVVKEFDKEKTEPDVKKIPSDPKLSASFLQPTLTSYNKRSISPGYSSSKLQAVLPIKNRKAPIKTKPRVQTFKKEPEESLMKAFDIFVNSLPSKVAPELIFPLFKEMTGRAVNLVAEYNATIH